MKKKMLAQHERSDNSDYVKNLSKLNRLLVALMLIILMLFPVQITSFTGGTNPKINLQTNLQANKLSSASPSIYKEIYVSPQGNDNNNGTINYPLKSIAKAQERVREINDLMVGDIIVYLREGIYFLNSTLNFNKSDGGKNGFDVIYSAYQNETVIISGGVELNPTDWKKTGNINNNGNKYEIWEISSPVDDTRQLYINEKRAIRARGNPVNLTSTDGDGHRTKDSFMKSWRNLQDIEFVYQDIWTLPRVHVFMIKKDFIYMQQPAYSFIRYKPDSQNKLPVWIENAFELMDEPGEFYMDKNLKKIYYIPRVGENLTDPNTKVVVPRLETLVNISGSSVIYSSNNTKRVEYVSNLKFSGISFKHGSWLEPNRFGLNFVDIQANVYRTQGNNQWTGVMSPGNIMVEYANNIEFYKCKFNNLGSGGLVIKRGVQNSSIIGNSFMDISGIAIQIGEISNPLINTSNPDAVMNIIVKNNYITNCSAEYMSGPGIFATYVRNVRIEHNTISNLPYTGISLGWGWSAKETICANNSVKYNRIYGVMNFLKDGGGIYTLSTQPGTNVSYNVIHDSGWNGLYPDERTNQTTWSYNVVWNCYNSFLDHSMYEESHWNDVFNNYLDTYPRYLWVWYPDRDDKQIFGLRPGDKGFPDDIVMRSGVEEDFQYLVPENEFYWKFSDSLTINPLSAYRDKLLIFSLIFIGFGIVAVIFTISFNKKPDNFDKRINEKGRRI